MPTDVRQDDLGNYQLQSVEAVLAGTFALMSAYAHCSCGNNKETMARKIVHNLGQLSSCIGLAAQFRMTLHNLHGNWQEHIQSQYASPPDIAAEREARLWHSPPLTTQ